MYKLLVPINTREKSDEEKEKLVKSLKKAKVDMVMLIFNRVLCNDEVLNNEAKSFNELKEYLISNGLKVGAWFAPTIGYGSVHYNDNDAHEHFVPITTTNGNIAGGAFCPLDDNFVAEFSKNLTTIAKTGVEYILLEDDFTLSGGKTPKLSCCCHLHIAEFEKRLGEKVTPELLAKHIYFGGKNKYRDAWIDVQGDTLRHMARAVQKAVHSVNPAIRVGLSANMSSYDMECVDIFELATIASKGTKPFLRLTGAPYWDNNFILSPNIEAVRLQTAWCNEDIDMITEGDTYPRPKHWVPAAKLEAYDMILRASGGTSGILKYMYDYTSKTDYETGYVNWHIKNEPHYDEIEKRFSDMECVGLNVYEKMHLFKNRDFAEDIQFEGFGARGHLPIINQWFMCENSIPLAYGRRDCASVVFGESAKYIEEDLLKNGIITDAQGAKFLMARGIDVGIKSMKAASSPCVEYFPQYDDINIVGGERGDEGFYEFELSEKAEVLSEFIGSQHKGLSVAPKNIYDAKKRPACYYYENEQGYKFMVYSFVPLKVYVTSMWRNGFFRSYYRQRQLAEGIAKLQGRPLPAMCFKNPELYILCKKNDNKMAVGLWNLFADGVLDPEIYLDDEYTSIDFYNCTGRLEGNKVILDDILPAYGFAFFTVTK